MTRSKAPEVVIIGGGTGTYVTLSALKPYQVELTSIVTVADSGGSTGRLRDEFGFLPVGDLRQALAAFAKDEHQDWIRKVLLYRFEKGSGLEGHNLGNLILTALQDMSGSTAKAVEIASDIFRLKGKIFPITTKDIQLVIEYEDGTVVIGEDALDDSPHAGKSIVSLKTSPKARIYKKAKVAIETADYIIIGPGDLYGSILPNLIIQGSSKALRTTNAKLIYIANLMTKYAQTHGMTITDHIRVLEKAMDRHFDTIIINSQPIPANIAKAYKDQHEYPLKDDLDTNKYQLIRQPLTTTTTPIQSKADKLKRSYLRHDPKKLGNCIINEVIKK